MTGSKPAQPSPDDIPSSLETVLSAMIEAHEQLLAVTAAHRGAISRADGHGVQACIERSGDLTQRIAELEIERRRITTALAGKSAAPPTVSSIASALPEPVRGRILSLAARLRELLLRVRQEMKVIKSATQSLVAHMDGLMQQVARTLSRTRLYDPRGRIDAGGPVACGLDLTH